MEILFVLDLHVASNNTSLFEILNHQRVVQIHQNAKKILVQVTVVTVMEMVSILFQQQLTTTRSNNVKKRMSLTDSTQISSINEHKVAMKADAL